MRVVIAAAISEGDRGFTVIPQLFSVIIRPIFPESLHTIGSPHTIYSNVFTCMPKLKILTGMKIPNPILHCLNKCSMPE